MTLLSAQSVAKSFDQGLSYIFSGVAVTLDEGKHIGLVGANGCGKSTFLKIVAGLEECEGVLQRKRGLRVGYQIQEPSFAPALTVGDVLRTCFQELQDLQEQLHVLEEAMASQSTLKETAANSDIIPTQIFAEILEEYGVLQERFEVMGGYTYEQEILRVITGLGLKERDQHRAACSLSGGEKNKLLLACQLLEKPDLLLLDEPTNHLDVESLEWLEEFLKGYQGTFLIVSHDRSFLDQVAEEIWELEHRGMIQYKGNYTQYAEEKGRRQKHQWKEYEKQQREIASLNQQIQDQRSNATQAEKGAWNAIDGDKSFHAKNAAKVAKKVKVAEAKREKLLTAKKVSKPFTDRPIQIHFPVETRTGGTLLHAKELTMGYDPAIPLFRNLSFSVGPQSRIGVVGPNGAGKTTLFRLLLGQLQPMGGEIVMSGRVQLGYYSQEQETLHEDLSALQNIFTTCPVDETTARTILGSVKMEKDKVHVPVRHLSGGEKSKVQLCKILLSGANVLILDEPTNHLDIPCREAVEEALLQYPGAILFISHDRYFLHKLADTIVYLHGDQTRVHYGDYASFRTQISGLGIDSPEEMVQTTRLAALLSQLSLLKDHQDDEKERLQAEIFGLQQEMKVSFPEESSN